MLRLIFLRWNQILWFILQSDLWGKSLIHSTRLFKSKKSKSITSASDYQMFCTYQYYVHECAKVEERIHTEIHNFWKLVLKLIKFFKSLK